MGYYQLTRLIKGENNKIIENLLKTTPFLQEHP